MNSYDEFLSRPLPDWGISRATLRNVLAAYEIFLNERDAARIQASVASARRSGQWRGATAPFGYRRVAGALVPDPETAPVVRLIFELYDEFEFSRPVVEELARRGIVRMPSRRPWRSTHLYAVLRNCAYIGEVPYGGERHPGTHPPLVAKALWERVQAILARTTADRTIPPHGDVPPPLKGLLRCARCGRLFGYTWSRKARTGEKYGYYVHRAPDCPSIRLRSRDLDATINPSNVKSATVSSGQILLVLKDGTQDVIVFASSPSASRK